jgi:hypothetical protein
VDCDTSLPAWLIDINARKQVIEHALLDDDGQIRFTGGLRELEQAFVETLVKNAEATMVEKQNLQSRTPTTKEDEQSARPRRPPHSLLDDAAQPIEPPAQIDWLKPNENLDPVRDHACARASITSSTAASVLTSKPGSKRRRVAPTSSITA